ncbi:MAG: hypothetical protein IJR58_03120 [Lachnospiraceae bacterium]|nr:hypothetical protein [Lachnospiraceae bacterium]
MRLKQSIISIIKAVNKLNTIVAAVLIMIISVSCQAGNSDSNGMTYKVEEAGFSYLEEETNDVIYYAYITVTNDSKLKRRIEFHASSNEDFRSGFIKNEYLITKEVKRIDGGEESVVPLDSVWITPGESLLFQLICVGEYGGNGKIMRHGPQKIVVSIVESI